MAKLCELAKLIRSKNAGPFMTTIDIIFGDRKTYDVVLESGVLTKETVASLYQIPETEVNRYLLPLACAIKFSFPRKHPSGDFLDEDLYGCQQHRPMVGIEVPETHL